MAIEGVGGSIISKIAELMVEPVGRQFRYMFCFNDFVKEFEKQKEMLVSEKERLQDNVKDSERNGEDIYENVKKWLGDANNEIEDAKSLENEIGKNGKCFTWCPNCMRQFKLSKALAKKSETFREHLEKKPTIVSHRAHPEPKDFLPSKEFTPLKSSEEALKQIMEALKDDSVNMIRLCGMGGVGKTTLVRRVDTIARELQLFDEVLMATVSQNPKVVDIQHEMEDKLGLDIKEKSDTGRAARLRQRLKKVEKILIILDDVWNNIDLEAIGIPFGDDHRGCKILLTTRHQFICSSMECQQKVFLRELPEDEAWALFRIKAGLRDGDSTLNKVAREVARECQGLPIALVTVGRALRGKSRIQWELASTQLKESQFVRMEQIDEQNNVYTCLKLSYDYLRYDETKSCFLLCCLFPEDYNIPIEDLTRCAVGYGLHAGPIEDARKRVSVAIEALKDCCMLLGTETEEHVKMHDLVRDFAIQIASSEYGFMVKAGIGLKEWPFHDKSFEGCTTISLMGNKLAELPEGLVCPKLKVLLLELDDGMNVPQRFFEGMKEIEVLSLKGGCLSLQSLELSTKLQSLVLIWCGCKDLIWLRKLQRLRILVFQRCISIEELPDEIGELKELRLLDVTGCRSLRRIPVNLIGRLKKLEELLIGDYSFDGWDVDGCDSTGGMNASLTELNSLSQLAVLSLRIPKVECIPRDFVFPVSLRKYHIILGNWFDAGYPSSTRFNLVGTSFNAKTFEQLFLHKLEFVKVRGCGDVFILFPARLRQGLKNLKELIVASCESLEEVFELEESDEGSSEEKELPLLSSLTKLQLSKLPELKCIWKGPTRNVSLQSLVVLQLGFLDKLTFIFTPSLAQSLPKLESLRIGECGELKHIIREEDGGDVRAPFPAKLLQALKNLKSVKIEDCKSLEEVFELGEADEGSSEEKELPLLSSLTKLQLSELPQLKCIWKGPTGHVSLRSLARLYLDSLDKLAFIFTPSLAQSLPKLETLQIKTCGELKHIIREEDGEREIIPESPRFPKLKEIFIQGCGKLEYVFPVSVSPSLRNLEEMTIYDGDNLKQIFYSGEGDALPTDGIIKFPRLRALSLSSISNYSFFGPKNFAAQLPSLQYLKIDGHKELENLSAQLQGLTNLKRLSLTSLPDMRCIWKGLVLSKSTNLEMAAHGEQNGSLQRLECVQKINLKTLKEVIVDSCESLEEVFELGEADEEVSLTKLQLSKLPELKCIWKGPTGHVSLQSLVVLKLDSLDKLPFIFTPSLAQSLPKLESLHIRYCGELKHIIREEDGEREIIPESPCFPQLKSLLIYGCGKLEYVFPVFVSLTLLGLPQLQTLEIKTCGELKHIIREEDGEREIIPESPRFPKLKTLRISGCGKLEYVFTVSVSPRLSNLEEMMIDGADNLKQIFYSGEGDALPTDFIIKFPRLRRLSLSNCSFFGPKNFAAQLPSLQYLEINGHKELGNLSAQLQGLTNLETLSLKSLPDMRCIWKGLVLRKLTTLEMAAPGEQNGSLQRLECVQVNECGDVTAKFLQINLKTLKELIVASCESLEEVFELEESDEGSSEEKELPLLSSLTKLQLSKLPELKCIWKGPTRNVSLQSLVVLQLGSLDKLTFIFTTSLAQSLPKLEIVDISDCGELKHIIREEDGEGEIIPESPRFPKLKTLRISGCGKLEYVFTVSVSPSLPNLEEMIIDRVDNLKQIFYNGEGDALPTDGIIKFPRLRELSLSNCSFFGPKNFAAQLPSLQILEINGHKELGNLSAQLQGLTNLKRLSLTSLPDMRCIWKGLVLSKLTTLEQNGFLQRLESVHLDDCGDVRAPFPAKLLQALKNLDSVKIKDCKSLEEVFELGEADEGSSEEKELPLLSSLTQLQLSKLPELKCIWKGPTGHVSLRSLARLYLDSLDKLAFIFTPSLAQRLPKLESLRISDCGELKHIIREEDGEREIIPESPGQDDQASPVNVEKEIVLPNLKVLWLEQLSSIVCFSFGWCDYFLFPRLEKLKVHQCPKLTTKFATTPDGSMSAQSKVSEVAEDSSINREWTRNKGWKVDGDSCL